MATPQEIEQVEITLEFAKKQVAMGDAIRKLYTNREFKKVFVEGYFKDEAVRLTALLGDPSLQDDEQRKQVIKSLDAIGVVQAQVRAWLQLADQMRSAIQENSELLDEMRSEEAEEAEEA